MPEHNLHLLARNMFLKPHKRQRQVLLEEMSCVNRHNKNVRNHTILFAINTTFADDYEMNKLKWIFILVEITKAVIR